MTFQHRSRIKSTIDYDFIASAWGACCDPDATSVYAAPYRSCIDNDHYFIPTELDDDGNPILIGVVCPNISERGCCCACNYVDDYDRFFQIPGSLLDGTNDPSSCENSDPLNCYQGGVRSNITKCECDKLNGIWIANPEGGEDCPIDEIYGVQQLCTNGFTQKDVRWPGACCIDGICNNVCSVGSCSNLEGSDEDTQWRPFEICGESPGVPTAPCWDGSYREMGVRDIQTGILVVRQTPTMPDRIKTQQSYITKTSTIGSCCVYMSDINPTCSSLNEDACRKKKGIWGNVDSEGDFYNCDSSNCQAALNVFENEGSISASYVNGWNLGELVFGGRFLGVFNVQSSSFGSGSECFGNPDTGEGKPYRAISDNDTTRTNSTFAIFCSNRDMFASRVSLYNEKQNRLASSVNNNSSLWDPQENVTLWEDPIQREMNKTNPQFIQWTLPSLDMLSFAYKQMKEGEFITNTMVKPNIISYGIMRSGYYWTNSLYNKKIADKTCAYVQYFGGNKTFVVTQPVSGVAFVRPFLVLPII